MKKSGMSHFFTYCFFAAAIAGLYYAMPTKLVASDSTDVNIPSASAAITRRTAMETIRMVSFRMKDGRTVSGRVVSDDRTQITVSEPVGGIFVSTSYNRLDIEPRTINYQSLSEYQYWLNMGQLFEGRTWDFRDDPDEFAQSLRCYQTARDLAGSSMGSDSAVAKDVELRINKLLESRKRWIEDVEPRAKMAEYELKSTLSARLDDMNKTLARMQNEVEQLNRQRTSIETALANYQRDVDNRLTRMADDIRRNYEYIRDNIYRSTIVVPGTGSTK